MAKQRIASQDDPNLEPSTTQAKRPSQNLRSPVFKLPVELLLEIFLVVKDSVNHSLLRGWFRVSHVCKHWREVALAARSLWTRIYDTPNSFIPAMLERSHPAPICISFRYLPPVALLTTILQEIERTRSIVLDNCHPDNLNTIESVLRDMGREWEPRILESLKLHGEYRTSSPLAMDFFRPTERLKKLHISDGIYKWNMLPLPNLTELKLFGSSSLNPVSGAEFMEALRHMPDLQTLGLSWDKLGLVMYPPTPLPPPIHLLFLQALIIHKGTHEEVGSFLSLILHPRLRHLTVSCYPLSYPDSDDSGSGSDTIKAVTQAALSSTARGDFRGLEFLHIDIRSVTLSAKAWPVCRDEDEPSLQITMPFNNYPEPEDEDEDCSDMSVDFTLDVLYGLARLNLQATLPLPIRHLSINAEVNMSVREFCLLFSALPHLESVKLPEIAMILFLAALRTEDYGEGDEKEHNVFAFSFTFRNLRSITWLGEYKWVTDVESIPPMEPSLYRGLCDFLSVYRARNAPIRRLELDACELLDDVQLTELQNLAVEVIIREPYYA